LRIRDESRRTCETGLRSLDVPGVGRAAGTHSSSCIPEVGTVAFYASFVGVEVGLSRRADASELVGLEHEGSRAAGLIACL